MVNDSIRFARLVTMSNRLAKENNKMEGGRIFVLFAYSKIFILNQAYLMERSVIELNRTTDVPLGSVIEHNRTHTKIWSIEQNCSVIEPNRTTVCDVQCITKH